jgi:hypothetical protein
VKGKKRKKKKYRRVWDRLQRGYSGGCLCVEGGRGGFSKDVRPNGTRRIELIHRACRGAVEMLCGVKSGSLTQCPKRAKFLNLALYM